MIMSVRRVAPVVRAGDVAEGLRKLHGRLDTYAYVSMYVCICIYIEREMCVYIYIYTQLYHDHCYYYHAHGELHSRLFKQSYVICIAC